MKWRVNRTCVRDGIYCRTYITQAEVAVQLRLSVRSGQTCAPGDGDTSHGVPFLEFEKQRWNFGTAFSPLLQQATRKRD